MNETNKWNINTKIFKTMFCAFFGMQRENAKMLKSIKNHI